MFPSNLHPRVDRDGFLVAAETWSEDLARELAKSSGIETLTEAHWRVLRYLRNHYLAVGAVPAVRNVCRETGLYDHCVEKLFGNDMKRAWRIAGLPNPGEEAKAYMG